jgi:hypothetical protein
VYKLLKILDFYRRQDFFNPLLYRLSYRAIAKLYHYRCPPAASSHGFGITTSPVPSWQELLFCTKRFRRFVYSKH